LDDYRGDAEWAFLEKVARHVGYNHVRSKNAKKRGGVSVTVESYDASEEVAALAAELVVDESASPEAQLVEAEQLRRVQIAIAALPDGMRHCLTLRLSGLKYEEIAKALRLSVDAVKSRIRDAQKRLREQLGDEPLKQHE
jgi:RNA polymerase sigma factor (sigma-70 family)